MCRMSLEPDDMQFDESHMSKATDFTHYASAKFDKEKG
jgi:hypothetical protein